MPRYIRQKDDYSCAPMAIYNARKWMGHKVSYKRNYKKIVKACDCKPETGTYDSGMACAISKFFKINECYKKDDAKLFEVEIHLNNGGAIIFDHLTSHKDGANAIFFHSVFCTKTLPKRFNIINAHNGEKNCTVVSRERFKKLLRPYPTYNPGLWFLHKK